MQINSTLHLGSKESAECIVSELVRENATIVLDIQKQLVDDQLILGETPVGRYVRRSTINNPTSSSNLKLAARDST
jgi:hypothetical protein